VQFSPKVTSIIQNYLPPSEAPRILQELASLDESDFDGQDPDRVAGAILILVKRGSAGLPAIIAAAKTDWRDLLMGAGLADDDWEFKLQDIIGSW
jgi:hypothetical protein